MALGQISTVEFTLSAMTSSTHGRQLQHIFSFDAKRWLILRRVIAFRRHARGRINLHDHMPQLSLNVLRTLSGKLFARAYQNLVSRLV